MAFRMIQNDFWTDSKIVDDFSPEDKYFYLYLLTTPLANSSGCYEVSIKTMAEHLGWNKETVEKLLERFEVVLNVIRYSRETKEILILNWAKYNWTDSPKFRKGLEKHIKEVKNLEFKAYLTDLNNGIDTVSIPYTYTVSVSVSNSNIKENNNNITNINKKKSKNKYYPDNENLNNAFLDYIDMRKKTNAPMTDRAILMAMNKLEELSNGNEKYSIAILEQSIFNNWKGLFPLKEMPKETKNISERQKRTTEQDEKELSKFIRGE